MEVYIKGIGVSLISSRPAEDAGGFCEEVSLNRVALSNFAIGASFEGVVSLCRLILDLDCHNPW